MLDWLLPNEEWRSAVLGVAVIADIRAWLQSNRYAGSALHQTQRSGSSSTDILLGRDVKTGGNTGTHGR